jgi:hypothetical protein
MSNAKLTKIDGVELIAENEFSKTFKYTDEINEIDLFIAKAFDDEQDKHYVVASIPYIKEVNSERVQFPFIFNDEQDRDNGFLGFDVVFAKSFVPELINMIKKQNEEKRLKEEEEAKQEETKQLTDKTENNG